MASQLFMIFGLGGTELVLILLVVLLLFGAKKIPELARGLGSGIREFKDASREIKREIDAPDRNATTSAPANTTGTEQR
jgi:sec-independent protein translocase protein TatA